MLNKLIIDYVELISLNFYKIIFKPFVCEKFFCNTILNILKHFIFVNNDCSRITEVSFNSKTSEYGYISGLKEDILNIILNLRNIIFKLKKKKNFLKLKSNKKIVKASDIILKKGVKILNPNYIICNLSEGSKLKLKIKVEKSNNLNKKFNRFSEIKNGIFVDSDFSPVVKCFYNIVDVEDSIFQKLKNITFYIETDGSINGKNIFIKSLNNYLKIFSSLKKKIFKNNKNFYKNISLIDCGFSFRTIKFLYNLNIYNLENVLKYDLNYFLENKYFSIKTVKEIKKIFKNYKIFS